MQLEFAPGDVNRPVLFEAVVGDDASRYRVRCASPSATGGGPPSSDQDFSLVLALVLGDDGVDGPRADSATLSYRACAAARPVAASKPVELDDGLAVLLESVGDPRLPNAVQKPDGPVELVEGSVGGLSISLDLLLSVRVPGVRGAHSSPFG
jgi:hypothetical protein